MEERIKRLTKKQKKEVRETFEANGNLLSVLFKFDMIACPNCTTPKISKMWIKWAIENKLI